MNEIQQMQDELERIKEFLEKSDDCPAFAVSLYNIAKQAVELAYNVHIKHEQSSL